MVTPAAADDVFATLTLPPENEEQSIACLAHRSSMHLLDQVVNAVGLTIWSMLIGLATWSMMGGGVGGIDAITEILSVVDCS